MEKNRIITVLKRTGTAIDTVNEWSGKLARWLILPLTFFVFMDVMLRYVFNSPTIWAWDINVQLLGVLGVLGGGYNLRLNGHIGVDVLSEKMAPRKKAMLSAATYLFFLFAVGVLLWKTAEATWVSVATAERFNSYFMPPIYHVKVIMFLGVLLLLLQGIRKFVGDVVTVVSSKGRAEK